MNIAPAVSQTQTLSRPDKQIADLQTAARGFEAIFLQTLMKGGDNAVLNDELTGGKGVEMATDMFKTHIADSTSSLSNLGIARAVFNQYAPSIGAQADSMLPRTLLHKA